MAERFKVGEIAVLILLPGQTALECWAPYVGQEVEIVGGLRKREFNKVPVPISTYVVRAQDGSKFGVEPPNLQKKRLPPPREEVGEWELCPWKPGLHQTV